MISAIVATDKNYGIGYENKLLCHIKEDLRHFRKLTSNNIVVMGRKTWVSLPNKPLPNRTNIVITNSVEDTELKDGVIFTTLNNFKDTLKEINDKHDVFVIGGGQIYKELLPYCDNVYLTRIHKSFENVDTYFPKLKEDEWYLSEITSSGKQGDIEYQFEIYKRKGE